MKDTRSIFGTNSAKTLLTAKRGRPNLIKNRMVLGGVRNDISELLHMDGIWRAGLDKSNLLGCFKLGDASSQHCQPHVVEQGLVLH